MHFESTGRIAQPGIDPQQLGRTSEGRARFAEHRTRAGVVLGPFIGERGVHDETTTSLYCSAPLISTAAHGAEPGQA